MDEGEETGGQGLRRRRRGVRAHDVPADALINRVGTSGIFPAGLLSVKKGTQIKLCDPR